MSINRVVEALGAHETHTKGTFRASYRAKCPCHDDQHPSLDIDVDAEGKVLLICRVCGPTALPGILSAANLTTADLFADKPKEHRGRIVATFDYHDENGNLVYQACRIEPGPDGKKKSFFQQRPARLRVDGTADGWIKNLDGVPRVLYRLPELQAADAENWVFVPEGEKKVDALRGLGCVATCNVGGAKKWLKTYTAQLKGRRVCILPDNDEPGREHAAVVAASLAGIAACVAVVALPGLAPKGDVLDWLATGGTVERLYELIAVEPVWTAPSANGKHEPELNGKPSTNGQHPEIIDAPLLVSLTIPDARWAIPNLVPEGFSFLAGKPKLGKSWMCLDFALAIAFGGKALGKLNVRQGKVLYLALEDTKRRLQSRLRKLLSKIDADAPPDLFFSTKWKRHDKGGLADIGEWVDAHKDTARLIIIDTWGKFRPPKRVGTPEYDQDYEHAGAVKDLADKYAIAIMATHHCRKLESDDPLDGISGTLGLSGCADAALVLKRERGQHDATLYAGGRDIEPPEEIALRWEAEFCCWSIMGEAEEYRLSKERTDVINLLREQARPMTPSEVAPLLRKNPSTTKWLLWQMSKDAQIQGFANGMYGALSTSANLTNRANGANSPTAPTDEEVVW